MKFEDRIMNSVAPCISHLAVTTQDDSAGKALNYQVLLKARHSSPKVGLLKTYCPHCGVR